MKKRATGVGIAMLVLCVVLMFATGCAKKAVSKDEGLAAEKKAAAAGTATGPATAADAREQALKADAAAAAAAAAAAKGEFEDIRFAFDKSVIEAPARVTLKKLADWLLKNKDYALAIEGHCDERGTVEYNLALGQRRADAAMKYLVDLGVEKGRISTISYGKERPLDPRSNEEAWAKNRRANFTVKKK